MAPREQWADFHYFEKPTAKLSPATAATSYPRQRAKGRSSLPATAQPSVEKPDRKVWPKPWGYAAVAFRFIRGGTGQQKSKTPNRRIKDEFVDDFAHPATEEVEGTARTLQIQSTPGRTPSSTARNDGSRVTAAPAMRNDHRPWSCCWQFLGVLFMVSTVAWLISQGLEFRKIPVVSNPLFGIERWDKILDTTTLAQAPLHNLTFANSDQIRESIDGARIAHHRCRIPMKGVSEQLGMEVTVLVQEWVLNSNCTSALPLALRGAIGHVEGTLDCMKVMFSHLSAASSGTEDAAVKEGEQYNAIVEAYKPGLLPSFFRSGQTQAQLRIDGQRQRQAQEACNVISRLQEQMVQIRGDWQAEYDRLARLKDDLMVLLPLVESMDYDGTNRSGNCLEFPTVKIRDLFLSLASRASGRDKEAQEFHSRFHKKVSGEEMNA